MGPLKTGTPPRLSRKSIDFEDGVNRGVFHVEHGDAEPIPFSFTASEAPSNKAACYLMHTTTRCISWSAVESTSRRSTTVRLRDWAEVLPISRRQSDAVPDRERHQLFLEPKGSTSRRFTSTVFR
jgi:tRNA uridine 5-carboxymethylaminomethyl modification enzyme